ncbi:MAG: hypothetical protein ICV55_07310, partial [Coleofasciculus sp. C3-bin4]|nr:hypothetical protein [Coleofasciculus sp. C3-bin4]
AIAYLLGKDITVAPRYHFVYYPAVVAMLGASLASKGLKVRTLKVEGYAPSVTTTAVSNQSSNLQPTNLQPATQIQPSTLLLSLSLLSCVFVVSNLVFLKPFHPQQVARDMTRSQAVPIMMVVGYNNFQDVALGLSFALAIDPLNADIPKGTAGASFAFLDRKLGYELVWQKLSKLPVLAGSRLNLWVVAPGLKRRDYPQQLAIAPKGTAAGIAGQTSCTLDRTQYHRIGIPYQLYRCN